MSLVMLDVIWMCYCFGGRGMESRLILGLEILSIGNLSGGEASSLFLGGKIPIVETHYIHTADEYTRSIWYCIHHYCNGLMYIMILHCFLRPLFPIVSSPERSLEGENKKGIDGLVSSSIVRSLLQKDHTYHK